MKMGHEACLRAGATPYTDAPGHSAITPQAAVAFHIYSLDAQGCKVVLDSGVVAAAESEYPGIGRKSGGTADGPWLSRRWFIRSSPAAGSSKAKVTA